MTPIEVEFSYALDDSCQMQPWARGHHDREPFRLAVARALRAHNGSRAQIGMYTIQHVYQRSVPCRDSIVADRRFVHSEGRGRGAYPITVMECWLPIFRRSRKDPRP